MHLLHSLLHNTDWNSRLNKHFPHPKKRNGIYQIRRRIPAALADAYPENKKEAGFSLRTKDLKVALQRLLAAEVQIEHEFAAKRRALEAKSSKPLPCIPSVTTVNELSGEQMQQLSQSWKRQVILSDQHLRSECLPASWSAALHQTKQV